MENHGVFESRFIKMDFSEKISIVMPVYNTDVSILREAVDSMLNQTFESFEFIIVDDGSGPCTRDYLRSLTDPRIRLIRNETNLGATKSLNVGFRAARGKYIARMDSDDISLPSRLEKQYAFMESHPEVIVCGAQVEVFGSRRLDSRGMPPQKELDMDAYRVKMLFVNPGPRHPTAFFSHEKLLRYHILYDETLRYAQDYAMWAAVSRYGEVRKLDEILLRYRTHEGQSSSAHRQLQIQCDQATQRKLLAELLGSVTDEEVNRHYMYSTGYYSAMGINPEIDRWYRRLLTANRQKHIYHQKKLKRYITCIKCQLIEQSFGQRPALLRKIALFFRYLPFPSAIRATGKTVLGRISP